VTNERTDSYGGSFENRFLFLREIVAAVTEVFPADRIGVRLAPNGSYGGMGSADNFDMFSYALAQLDPLGLAYVHVMNGLGFGEHKLCQHVELADVRKLYSGCIMGNIGYTQEMAEAALKSGNADLIAFGRPFICNPDLVERFAKGYPLTDPAPYEVWWNHSAGSKGYTDYQPYSPPDQVDA
jgi:N-ethylmaleimide reductase